MSKFIISSNQFIASIAMTEPDAGSDLQGIRTTAKSVPNVFCLYCIFHLLEFRRDGDDWIINGSKIYITNG